MNKLISRVLPAIGLLALPVHAQAQRPFDYFNAGQFMEFSNNINNLKELFAGRDQGRVCLGASIVRQRRCDAAGFGQL